jgi:hypothetical protein
MQTARFYTAELNSSIFIGLCYDEIVHASRNELIYQALVLFPEKEPKSVVPLRGIYS